MREIPGAMKGIENDVQKIKLDFIYFFVFGVISSTLMTLFSIIDVLDSLL